MLKVYMINTFDLWWLFLHYYPNEFALKTSEEQLSFSPSMV